MFTNDCTYNCLKGVSLRGHGEVVQHSGFAFRVVYSSRDLELIPLFTSTFTVELRCW